jgi:hypothetical protein
MQDVLRDHTMEVRKVIQEQNRHAPSRQSPHQALCLLWTPVSEAQEVESCLGRGAVVLRTLSPPVPWLERSIDGSHNTQVIVVTV